MIFPIVDANKSNKINTTQDEYVWQTYSAKEDYINEQQYFVGGSSGTDSRYNSNCFHFLAMKIRICFMILQVKFNWCRAYIIMRFNVCCQQICQLHLKEIMVTSDILQKSCSMFQCGQIRRSKFHSLLSKASI